MTKLAVCPCGKTPTDIGSYDLNQGGKWFAAVPNCCGEWMIEFRTGYCDIESEQCKRLAIEAWNTAPRAISEPNLPANPDEFPATGGDVSGKHKR